MFLEKFLGPKSYSDEEIIAQIRKGNKDMLVYLYENNYRDAGHFILKTGGTQRDIETVLHEVVIYFWQHVQGPEYEPPAEINTIIVHSANALWARMKEKETDESLVNPSYDLEVPIPEPDNTSWIKRLNIIANNMRLMSQLNKEVVCHTYFEQKNDKEISELLELNGPEAVENIRLKTLEKYENILQGSYVKRDLIN